VRRIRAAMHTLEQMRVSETTVDFFLSGTARFSFSKSERTTVKPLLGFRGYIRALALAAATKQLAVAVAPNSRAGKFIRLVRSAHARFDDCHSIHYKKFNFKDCCNIINAG
jgi:hypothetical protein